MDRLGGTPTMKPQDLAARKTQIANAFLAYRLNRSNLGQMAEHLHDSESEWNDQFTSLTDRSRKEDNLYDHKIFDATIAELGLPQKFQSLTDDQVWTREDRALYRRFAHKSVSPLEAPAIQVGSEYGEAFLNSAETSFQDWDRNGDLRLEFRNVGEIEAEELAAITREAISSARRSS